VELHFLVQNSFLFFFPYITTFHFFSLFKTDVLSLQQGVGGIAIFNRDTSLKSEAPFFFFTFPSEGNRVGYGYGDD
jgi:hypothetical protein